MNPRSTVEKPDADTLTVRVSFTVSVSREAWDRNYGTGTAARPVREDVRVYVRNAATEQLREVGVLADTSLHTSNGGAR